MRTIFDPVQAPTSFGAHGAPYDRISCFGYSGTITSLSSKDSKGLMKAKDSLPPGISRKDRLILFDGICKLCNAWSRFIIKYDGKRIFKLASVQSPEGAKILEYFSMPTDRFDTMLYVEGNNAYTKSEAFLRIAVQLGFPWNSTAILRLMPRTLRDWIYDRVALNRYRLFGKYDQCLLPDPDHKQRFLKNAE